MIVNISHRHKIYIHQFSSKLLLVTLLVHIACFSLHYGFVKFSKLTFEGVESNPSPEDFTINTLVSTSRHQDNSQYQASLRMQCTNSAYIATIFSSIEGINFWNLMILIASLGR